MRPKKHILLIDWREDRSSHRAFQLHINGYRVTQSQHPRYEGTRPIDLIIAVWTFPHGTVHALAERLMVPLMIFCDRGDSASLPAFSGDCTLFNTTPTVEVLERIKMLSARKRGPRKRVNRVPAQPEGVEVSA